MEPFDDQTRLVRGLFAATRLDHSEAWAEFLALLRGVTQADGAALALDGPAQAWRWRDGLCPDLEVSLRRALRFDRVYAQDSLPGLTGQGGPLRLIRVRAAGGAGVTLCIARGAHQRDFRSMDGQVLSGLAPFLGQAMELWLERADERARAAIGARMLADLGGAWIVFDPGGVIKAASARALEWGEATGLRLAERRRLEFADPVEAQDFRTTFAAAITGARPVAMPFSQGDLILSRAEHGGAEVILGQLRLAPEAAALPPDRLARHFGISLSEARLASLICDGHALKSAAVTLGWTEETVRSCSKVLFARLRASGQPALVRRVLNSAVWFSGAP